MDRNRDSSWEPTELDPQPSFSEPADRFSPAIPTERNSDARQFEFQPIIGPNGQNFGIEVLFRAGWEDAESNRRFTSRIMLDSCLLYGFDELTRGCAIFLTCTRETLLSGFLWLLPRSVVFQIPETVQADEEVVSACRALKGSGYRFALDDFESLEAMDGFLDLVHFIKVDFRHPIRRNRVCMLRRLKLTNAALIAKNVNCEQEFQQAVADGFELLQGSHCGENVVYANKSDSLDPVNCMGILDALDWPDLSIGDLADLISREPGIECRIRHRANWAVPGCVISSIQHALLVITRADVHKLVNLAIEAASEQCVNQALASESPRADARGDDALIRWFEMGAKAPWWWRDEDKGAEIH